MTNIGSALAPGPVSLGTSQGSGAAAFLGPPGASAVFPCEASSLVSRMASASEENHAEFAARFEQMLSGVSSRQAAAPHAEGTSPSERTPGETAPAGKSRGDAGEPTERARGRKGAASTVEQAAEQAAITSMASTPLVLSQGAAWSISALEPIVASAEGSEQAAVAAPDVSAIGEISTVGCPPDVHAGAPITPAASEIVETPVVPLTDVETAALATAAAGDALRAVAAAEATPPQEGAQTADAPEANAKAPSTGVPAQARHVTAVSPEVRDAAGLAESETASTESVDTVALSGPAAHKDDDGLAAGAAEPVADEIVEAGEGDPPGREATPEAPATGQANRPAWAAPVREEAAPHATPPSAHEHEVGEGAAAAAVDRPGRRQQGVPAEGAPEVLPGSDRATVVHWLQGSEKVDAAQAPRLTEQLVVSNLVADIRRLTFVGQERALLQLQPPELGRLDIRLSTQDGGLSIEMVVETEAVKAIVESTLGQLQTALSEHGVVTTGVFVGVGPSAHREPEQGTMRRGREGRSATAGSERIQGIAEASLVRQVGFGSTVDYRV